jgi:hypothetical protein
MTRDITQQEGIHMYTRTLGRTTHELSINAERQQFPRPEL